MTTDHQPHAAPLRVGFACGWGRDKPATWSGTPWQLLLALNVRAQIIDIDVSLPRVPAQMLRLAYARRSHGQWRSMWQHGRPATTLVERRLRARTAAQQLDAVLQIGDLGISDERYFILQDLNYDLLLDNFGADRVPHFGRLSRSQIVKLRDRQAEIYERATGLLPMSQWLATRMVAGGARADRVHVIHPGVNSPLNAEVPIQRRRQGRRRRLLFVGRDFDTKGGDQLIAAFAMLRAELGSEVTLTIAGPKDWPLPGAVPVGVEYLGPVPTSAVQGLYDSHDLFVMPSRFEGFGIAFVEALVRGLPCIGRQACAMPEIIDPLSGGRLVTGESPDELADLIHQVLGDDQLYEACAAAAPARREYYTWDRAADQVVTALKLGV